MSTDEDGDAVRDRVELVSPHLFSGRQSSLSILELVTPGRHSSSGSGLPLTPLDQTIYRPRNSM